MIRTVDFTMVAWNDATGVNGPFILMDGKFSWASCNDGGLDCQHTSSSFGTVCCFISWTYCSCPSRTAQGGTYLKAADRAVGRAFTGSVA